MYCRFFRRDGVLRLILASSLFRFESAIYWREYWREFKAKCRRCIYWRHPWKTRHLVRKIEANWGYPV